MAETESTPAQEGPPDVPPRFGRYALIKRLAAGGMGEVFLARFRTADNVELPAVVKRILPRLSDNQDFVEYFLHEGRIAALLRHPNIVQTLELGRTAGHYYIAMEYVRGCTLVKLLANAVNRQTFFSIPMVLYFAMQLARALDYVHTRSSVDGRAFKIIHMDLAPHNILITPSGLLKIMDFGIARSTGVSRLPARRDFRGRTSYLAPEQLQGLPLDQRLDLFAMGVIIHEMLLGRPLFRAREEEQTVGRILYSPIPRPRMKRPECPEQLEEVILRCLRRDRERRYQTAAEVLSDLERCQEDTGLLPSISRFEQEIAPLMDPEDPEAPRSGSFPAVSPQSGDPGH